MEQGLFASVRACSYGLTAIFHEPWGIRAFLRGKLRRVDIDDGAWLTGRPIEHGHRAEIATRE